MTRKKFDKGSYEGKIIRDPENRTGGPIDDMTPRGEGVPYG